MPGLVVILAIGGRVALFAVPLAREGAAFIAQFPESRKIESFVSGLTTPAAGVLHGVATGVVTVFVLTLLMVLEAPKIITGTPNTISDDQRRERVSRVAADCPRSMTGYVSGSLLISIICGVLT